MVFADTYLLLSSATKRSTKVSTTQATVSLEYLQGITTLCESLRDFHGLTVAVLVNLHGFGCMFLIFSIVGKTLALIQSSPAMAVSVRPCL